jgi:hypothetical protein
MNGNRYACTLAVLPSVTLPNLATPFTRQHRSSILEKFTKAPFPVILQNKLSFGLTAINQAFMMSYLKLNPCPTCTEGI